MVDAVKFLSEGFTLGISTGYLCLATCGPIYASYLMQHAKAPLRYFFMVLELSLGRFIAYLVVGALAGFLGGYATGIQRDYFTIIAYPLFSGFLVVSALRGQKCESGCAASRWSRFAEWPFLLGMLTGINVCPSFMLAFSRAVSLSGPVAGMLFFAAFFCGTSVFILPLSFIGMLGRKKQLRSIARVAAIGVAIWFTGSAARLGYDRYQAMHDRRPVINILDETPMYVVIDDTADARSFTSFISRQRRGPVYQAQKFVLYPSVYYLVADSIHAAGKDFGPLRSPGRFLIVIPAHHSDSTGVASMAAFLQKYNFRFNKKTGDVFFLK
jgi:sulfite exporter TauE/SafE